MNIVLIGSVFLYKGGIAHYTSLLCKALREEHQVEMISYSMQYPKLLFKRNKRTVPIEALKLRMQDTGSIRLIRSTGSR